MKNIKSVFFLTLSFLAINGCKAQQKGASEVLFTVNTNAGEKPISPYIYGLNDFKFPIEAIADVNVPNRRLGGNGFSTYNWENNLITLSPKHVAGNDYENSDREVADLTASQKSQPAIVTTLFHDENLSHHIASLITLPMMGYLPKDKGPLTDNETAPSKRFVQLLPVKGKPFQLTPDLNDNFVYTDENVNFLVHKYGGSKAPDGIKYYELDNEPDNWQYGHKIMHPSKPNGNELIAKSVATAKAIKSQDPGALVFALSYSSWMAHHNFLNDPTYKSVKSQYPSFTAWFLKVMKDSSAAAGLNLIDVIDMHYYSKAEGTAQGNETVDKGPNDKPLAIARMNAPSSLWDSTTVERSRFTSTNAGKPLNVIQDLQASIDKYYPGLKISFGEYNFGGWNHISGGIAEADFLGVLAKYGVFWASLWNTCPGKTSIPYYQLAGIKMYRNYDGKFSTFGNTLVASKNERDGKKDPSSSIYASYTNKKELHIIVINKDYDNPINGVFNIKGDQAYTNATIWKLDSTSSKIIETTPVNHISKNSFKYTVPPLSIIHIVVKE